MKKKIIITLVLVGMLFSVFSCKNLNAKDNSTENIKIEKTVTKTTKKQ